MNEQENIFAVCALIYDAHGNILTVSRKHDPNDLGLPGGKVDRGESPAGALIREVKEETGYSITIKKLVFQTLCQSKMVVTYLCEIDRTRTVNVTSSKETGKVGWHKPEDICENSSFAEYNRALFSAIR